MKNSYVRFFCPGDIDIPRNKVTQVFAKAGDRETQSGHLNLWVFAVDDWNFHIRREDKGIDVGVTCGAQGEIWPEGFDTRVEEALWLITGVPVTWSVLEEGRSPATLRALFRSHPQKARGFRLGPAFSNTVIGAHERARDLFAKYIGKTVGFRKRENHPVAVLFRRIYSASAFSIEAEALALSVSVERIVESVFLRAWSPRQVRPRRAPMGG